MKASPEGLFHLAHDGVYRSYDGNGRVIDYRQLNPEQIKSYLRRMMDQNAIQLSDWEDVDGRTVNVESAL
ncbi:hypothetical protein MMC30_005029 [Trapelia coarctata]|nr:hypothetical protein [Trapelia coarctata]